jgi:ribosomal protein S18 acetylase RimI-like enzyme
MIQLVPMTEAEYQTYLAAMIREYADDHIQAGRWQPDEALERAAEEFRQYLPEGVATTDNYLYCLKDEALGMKVGILWLARIKRGVQPIMFIYDIAIDEPQRRKGYGEQAMRAAEERAKALGLDTIALHVFGHNHAARALYEKLGYQITNINMAKKLTA